MKKNPSVFFTFALAVVAIGLFAPLFATGGYRGFDFWWWMATNAIVLTLVVVLVDGGWRESFVEDIKRQPFRKAVFGLIAAGFLYGVFFVGNLASRYVSDAALSHIEAVYNLKTGASSLRVTLLIGLIIGPSEEWFWRGFLQRRLSLQYNRWTGLIVTTILYTGMHLPSMNPMLVVAALVCGGFWGLLFMLRGSLLLCTVSHVAWDLAVFIIFPLVQNG